MASKTVASQSVWPVLSREAARSCGSTTYFTGRVCARGHVTTRSTQTGHCTRCRADNHLFWQRRAFEQDPEGQREKRRAYWNSRPAMKMFLGTRARAAKRGVLFTITPDDIVIPENCPCCDVRLDVRSGPSKKGAVPTSPSLDQIDAKQGYTPDNIAVICWRCNALKHDASIAELKAVVAWMERMKVRNDPWLRLVG